MSIAAFHYFLKHVNNAQAAHRASLDSGLLEAETGIIADNGLTLATITLTPQLAQQMALELAQQGPTISGPQAVRGGPQAGGPAMMRGMAPPGMGLGTAGAHQPPPNVPPVAARKPRKNDDD